MRAPENSGRGIALLGMAVSASLACAKLITGWLAGSTAVFADGLESVGDVLASGLLLFGLWVASRPPDDDHPYGHGRFETLTGLGLGLLLAASGAGIAFHSLAALRTPHSTPAFFAIWPLIASIALKSVLSVLKFRHGRRIGSSALIADAWNDAVDILSGSVALAAVGLAIYDPSRFLDADRFGGFVIGLIVVFLGIQVIRETTLQLVDTMPDARTMALIRREAMQVEGALGVEKCYARKTGLRYHVDLHLEVDPALTVRASHDIATLVRIRLKEELDWIADVLVHVEPFEGNAHDGKS